MRAWCVVVVIAGCGRIDIDPLSGDGGLGGTSDGAADAGPPSFFDPFTRPDQAGLGNNWIETTPGVFSITGNQVTRVASASDWTTNHVCRPFSEDVNDLEVSMEFVTTDVTTPDWPQIFVRGDSYASAYYVWLEYGPSASMGVKVDLARLGRSEGTWVTLDSGIVPTASVGQRYRLRLSAKGNNPVVLAGAYELWTGATWQALVTLSAQDSTTNAIATGHWGFSGNQLFTATYDNYSMTLL
jgi:hypothetical protein